MEIPEHILSVSKMCCELDGDKICYLNDPFALTIFFHPDNRSIGQAGYRYIAANVRYIFIIFQDRREYSQH